jgi:hypothetical protein
MIRQQIAAPASIEEARLIADWLVSNVNRNSPVLLDSLRAWDQQGCHLLARVLKGSPHFGHGNLLATTLRQVTNVAIVREHRLAARSDA